MDGVEHTVNHWDIAILHPPCTDIAVSGARYFEIKRKDGRQRAAIDFFCKCLYADVDRICVENPINVVSGLYIKEHYPDLVEKWELPIKPSQRLQPWQFGSDNFVKTTCLWEKNLPLLIPENTEKPEIEYVEWTDKKTGKKKRQDKWSYGALLKAKTNEERRTLRSKTFPGLGAAIAKQWGEYLIRELREV